MKTFLKVTHSIFSLPLLVTWFWFFLGPIFFGWTPDIIVAAVFCCCIIVCSTSDVGLMLEKYNFIDEDTLLGLGVIFVALWGVFIWNLMDLFQYRGVLGGTYLCASVFLVLWWTVFLACKIKGK